MDDVTARFMIYIVGSAVWFILKHSIGEEEARKDYRLFSEQAIAKWLELKEMKDVF